jgi:hypothetical protein
MPKKKKTVQTKDITHHQLEKLDKAHRELVLNLERITKKLKCFHFPEFFGDKPRR